MDHLEGAQAPLSTSMPVCVQQGNQPGADAVPDNEPYQPVIPGISYALLYPTLSALSSDVPASSGSPIPFYEQLINEIEEQGRLELDTT